MTAPTHRPAWRRRLRRTRRRLVAVVWLVWLRLTFVVLQAIAPDAADRKALDVWCTLPPGAGRQGAPHVEGLAVGGVGRDRLEHHEGEAEPDQPDNGDQPPTGAPEPAAPGGSVGRCGHEFSHRATPSGRAASSRASTARRALL